MSPPTNLDALLARDGMEPGLRTLVFASARATVGDQIGLGLAIEHARGLGVPRSELEETLLQGVLFHGFPRAVTAFDTLNRVWPAATPPVGGALPRNDWIAAGTRLFDAIYDRNAPTVHAMLAGFHGALHEFVLESAYGRVLSRPGLDPRRRELLAIAALAVLDQVPQLIAHARGARRFGADDAELREALVTALGAVESVDAHLRRIG